ncbi:hypothetical protein BGX38DRAFT_1147278 [Terfezia claveryi]|nr:hypothetical protein BGX38DRAFT_1147278 [Terfezia claveryi]
MDDRDRAQSERDSAINGKAKSSRIGQSPYASKRKILYGVGKGTGSKFERLRNSIKEDFNKQLADHQKEIMDHKKEIMDHKKEITDLRVTTRIHTQVLSGLALRNMLNECRDSFAKTAGYGDGWREVKKELQDRKITLTEVKGKMEGALQHVDWGSNGVGKVVSFVIDNWPIRRVGNISAHGGEGAEAMVYRDQLEMVIESMKDESDKRLLKNSRNFSRSKL